MAKVNYDILANNYDFLSRLVFQKSQVKAQIVLLKYIPANSRILIVGGGTGWILEEIAKLHTSGLVIDYVELSIKMIALSKQRNYAKNQINFINLPIENYNYSEHYDVILTPFLFDNFLFDKAKAVFNKLNGWLVLNGKWLQVDFVYDKKENKLWQKALLKSMYFFFRIICGIEASELVDMDIFFEEKYHKVFEAFFYFKFIKALVYQKTDV